MATPLLSLDMPRDLSRQVRVSQVAALVVIIALVVVGTAFATVLLYPIPAVGLLHAVMGAFVSGVTSLLMFEHAKATRRRGFLVIAITFLYLGCVLLVFPLTFPGAIVEDRTFLGSAQTSVGLFFAWHFAVPVGLSIASVVLYADQANHRRPSLTSSQVRVSAALAVLFVLVTIVLATQWPVGGASDLITPEGRLTRFSYLLKVATLTAALVFLVIACYCARNGAVISGWLAATAVLGTAEAVVSLNSSVRYTVGWYFSRLLWLVALSVLLVALIRSLSRVATANVALGSVDSLTGALSRTAFLLDLQREIARCQRYGEPVALLWLNVDRFKDINDELGHEVGDAVLRRLVRRAQRQLTGTDVVGRLGGDEFGVLLCDRDAIEAGLAAANLLSAVKRPVEVGEVVVHLTVAVGIARSPADATHADGLLHCADLAMNHAKAAGGDRCEAFERGMAAEALTRTQIRRELGEALGAGEFLLHYQPIYRLSDGRLVGAEALARWSHRGTLLPAGLWIPIAEASGQIIAISHEQVVYLERDLPRLIQAHGRGFLVTYNLSSRELSDSRLVDAVIQRLGPYSRHALLEVTESLELNESSQAAENLDRLRQAGLRIAIDDFGAGYSNLTRLERLRPTFLKTDRSLVQRAGSDMAEGGAFLRAACALADSLGCDVVVEGIETPQEEMAARASGARYVQGYRYARPGPLEDLLSIDQGDSDPVDAG